MPSVSVSVGHSGRMSRPLRMLSSIRLDSDCIGTLSLLIFYFVTFIPTVTFNSAKQRTLRRDCYNESRVITQRSLYIYTYDRGAPIAQLGERRTFDRKFDPHPLHPLCLVMVKPTKPSQID